MNEVKIQIVLSRLKEKLHQFIDTTDDIPYVAVPSEGPEIICIFDKIKDLSGYNADEVPADKEHWVNMILPDDQELVFDAFARYKKNGGTFFYIEYRIVHKNGSLRYIGDKGVGVFDNKGHVIRIEGLITTFGESREPEGMPSLEIKQVINSYANSNNFQKV